MNKLLLSLSIALSYLLYMSSAAVARSYPPDTKTLINKNKQLFFLENQGQMTDQFGKPRADIQYKVSTPGMTLFIGNGHLHYQWQKRTNSPQKTGAPIELYRMDVTLAGANEHAVVITEDPQQYEEHYIHGHDVTTVHACRKITYKNVYPYIDWVLYIRNDKVEYDFVVGAGGDIANIKLQYDGATQLHSTTEGGIAALTPLGTITERPPYSYEQGSGHKVATTFKLTKNLIRFDVAPYTGTLVIDPTIAWATYYGGTNVEQGNAVTCDTLGNVYFAGFTSSANNIASTGSYQSVLNAADTCSFLAKFNATGARLWATYLGGPQTSYIGYNFANAVACDHAGNVYIGGYIKDTTNISTTGAQQTAYGGSGDGYIAKFNGSGGIQWVTYYGGSGTDQILGIACDRNNNVFATGSTSSSGGISTSGSFQSSLNTFSNAFVVKFNSSGTRQWGTYYGGSGIDQANGITSDTAGNIYIAGQTTSSNFPVSSSCFQSSYGGSGDAFIAKFTNSGSRVWSTYYGGGNQDAASSIACDGGNSIYINGFTLSTSNIATSGSYQSSYTGANNVGMLVKFDSTGSRKWGTYVGDAAGETNGTAVTCDTGSVYVSGYALTGSASLATSGSYQNSFGGGLLDGYFEQFSSSGSRYFGSYYGGSGTDEIFGITTDNKGHVYICGITNTPTLYMASNSFQPIYGGGSYDAFLAKFTFTDTVVYFSHPFNQICEKAGGTFRLPYNTTFPFHTGNTFTAQVSDTTGSFANAINIGSISATTADSILCTLPTNMYTASRYRFRIIATSPADTSVDDGVNVTIVNAGITSNSPICKGDTVKMESVNTNTSAHYTWLESNASVVNITSITIPNSQYINAGMYLLTLSLGTCSQTDTSNMVLNYTPAPLPTYNGPICNGNTLDLYSSDTSSATTYQWTGPQGFSDTAKNPIRTNAVSIDSGYYVVVASNSQCSNKDSVKVKIQTTLSYLAVTGSDTICTGSTLSLNTPTGTPGITYSWTGPAGFSATTANISIPATSSVNTGTYYLSATKSGCISYADAVPVYIKPIPATPTAGNNTFVCQGSTIYLSASDTTPGNIIYSWNGPNSFSTTGANPTRATVPFADSGTYTVVATLNGCPSPNASTHIAVLPLPTGIAHSVNIPCVGDTIKLVEGSTTTGVTYNWAGPNSFVATNIRNPMIPNSSSLNTGMYHVTITAPNGCVANDSMTVSLYPLPATPTANNNGALCVGDTLRLISSTTTTGVTYSWSGPMGAITANSASSSATLNTVPITDSGVYTIKIRYTYDGCFASSTTHVVINPKPSPTVLYYDSALCAGSNISISPSPVVSGTSYSWTGPSGSIPGTTVSILNAQVSNSGKYYLTVTLGGCSIHDTAKVLVGSRPAKPVLTSTPICAGDTLKINASNDTGTVTYSWTGPSNYSTHNVVVPAAHTTDSGTYVLKVTQNGCSIYDTIVGTVNTSPTLSLSVSSDTICAGTNVTLVSGTTYNPVWTGPNGFNSTSSSPAISNITVADSGMYTLNAHFNGCYAKDSILVSVITLPAATYSTNSPICAGDSLKINITTTTPGVGYNWSGPSSYVSSGQYVAIPHASAANGGNYYLYVSKNGCGIYDTINTVVNSIPLIQGAGTNTPVCNGGSISLSPGVISNGIFSGWTGPNSFSSSIQNPGIANVIPTDSGNYVLHASNNGCNATDTLHVTIYTTNISYTSNNPVCAGDTLKLTGGSTTAGVTYGWTGPGIGTISQQTITIPNASAANAGTYTLNVTGHNCAVYDTLTVMVKPLPTSPTAGSNSPLCAGSTLNLTATSTTPGVSYVWTYPNLTTSTVQNPSIPGINLAGAGAYYVKAKLNNCLSAQATASVAVNSLPTGTVSSNTPVCLGDTIKLTSTVPTNAVYSWIGPNSFSSQLQDPTIANSTTADGGTYSLLLTLNGCSTTLTTPVSITSGGTPSVTISTPVDTVCKGDMATFTATALNAGSAPSYTWRINNVIVSTVGHTYSTTTLAEGDIVSCSVLSNGACQAVHTVVSNNILMHIVAYHPPPITVTISPATYSPGVRVTFTAITPGSSDCLTYQWLRNGVPIPLANTSSYSSYNLNAGDKINLFVHSTCPCTKPDTLLTNIISLDVASVGGAAKVYKVFPNPAQEDITIDGPGHSVQMEVYDMGGKQMFVKNIIFSGGSAQVHLSLAAGVYALHLTDDAGNYTIQRLVIME